MAPVFSLEGEDPAFDRLSGGFVTSVEFALIIVRDGIERVVSGLGV